MTNELDLTHLRAVAEAATPGPWSADDEHGNMRGATPAWCVSATNDHGDYLGDLAWMPQFVGGQDEANANHIATFDPPTVLALLSRLEQAEQLARINNQAMLEQTQRAGRAEQQVERKQQALDTVVKSLERQLEDVVKATDSQDLIGEDLDGDWDAVWGRLYDLADQKRDAAQAIGRALQLLQTWGKDSDSYHYAVQLGLALSNGDASVAESHLHALDGAS